MRKKGMNYYGLVFNHLEICPPDRIKWESFIAEVLLYDCTTWVLMKCFEKWDLHKIAMRCFEPIAEVAPYQAADVWQFAVNVTKHVRRKRHTWLS